MPVQDELRRKMKAGMISVNKCKNIPVPRHFLFRAVTRFGFL